VEVGAASSAAPSGVGLPAAAQASGDDDDEEAGADSSSVPRGKASGGIGFMVFDRSLSVVLRWHDPNGAAAITVARPGAQPIGIIGCYNPPIGSPGNKSGGAASQALLASVATCYRELVQMKVETVLITGDLNMRLGTVDGAHYTYDPATTKTPRTFDFRQFCKTLNVLPLAGRPAVVKRSVDLTHPTQGAAASTAAVPRGGHGGSGRSRGARPGAGRGGRAAAGAAAAATGAVPPPVAPSAASGVGGGPAGPGAAPVDVDAPAAAVAAAAAVSGVAADAAVPAMVPRGGRRGGGRRRGGHSGVGRGGRAAAGAAAGAIGTVSLPVAPSAAPPAAGGDAGGGLAGPHVDAVDAAAAAAAAAVDVAAAAYGATPAECTSRSISQPDGRFVAEVDYHLAPVDLPAGRFTVLQLSATVDTAAMRLPSTHRPVAVELKLLPSESRPPQRARPPARIPCPDYRKTGFWKAAGRPLAARIHEVATDAAKKPLAELSKQLSAAIVDTMRECDASVSAPAAAAAPGVGPVDGDGHGDDDAAAAAAAATGGDGGGGGGGGGDGVWHKHRRGRRSGYTMRTYRGRTMPAHVNALFDAARAACRAYFSARALAKRGAYSPNGLDALRQAMQAAQKAARAAAERVIKADEAAFLSGLEQRRVNNISDFIKLVKSISPSSPVAQSTSTIPGDDAPVTFTRFFASLSAETRASVPALAAAREFWLPLLRGVNRADAAAAERMDKLLVGPIDAVEVYMSLFPVDPELGMHLPIPGHDGCAECVALIDALSAWQRDDVDSPAPRLSCRLAGAKSAGSAGLKPEMVRFARPADLNAEEGETLFSWRMGVCTDVATILTQMYVSHRRVPDDDAFCASVLTPLHKKGDKADPNNYRGISAGNTPAKLLSSILCRRLKHWVEAVSVPPPIPGADSSGAVSAAAAVPVPAAAAAGAGAAAAAAASGGGAAHEAVGVAAAAVAVPVAPPSHPLPLPPVPLPPPPAPPPPPPPAADASSALPAAGSGRRQAGVPPKQAGFRSGNSAEGQVLALVETLRARARYGHDTYVLFLDLQKAYDSVHRGALSHMLKQMGMPAHFVDFIIGWFNQRRSSVLVNGQCADPFPVAKGLPQGEILAPDLFNLFITPLQYYLDELQGYHGVDWPAKEAAGARRLTIKDLWYADDMAALAGSVGELQLVLDAVSRWSADWGINIGFGDGKTAVMYVPAAVASLQDASRKPDVFAGSVKVAWVDEYRYLGMRLRADLTDADTLGMLRARLLSTGNRFIVYNKAVRSLSVVAQRQLVQMMVLGCVNYLMAVLPLTDTAISQQLDPPINRILRPIFGAQMSMPVSNLLADSGMAPMVALVAQHRVRLQQTLRLLESGQTPAALVARALEADLAAGGLRGETRTRSWAKTLHDTQEAIMMVTGRDDIPAAAKVAHVHNTSARLGREYAYHLMRRDNLQLAGCGTVDHPFGTPWRQTERVHMAGGLHCFGYFDCDRGRRTTRRLAVLGTTVAKTPASVWGAGFLGSPLGISQRLKSRHCAVITRARMGVDTMVSWPFAASASERRAADAAAEEVDTGADDGAPPAPPSEQETVTHRTARQPCVLCSTGAAASSPCSVWHLLFECTHPHIVEGQTAVYRSAERVLVQLCQQWLEAAKRAEPRDDDDSDDDSGASGAHGAAPPAAPPAVVAAHPPPAAPADAAAAPHPAAAAPAAAAPPLFGFLAAAAAAAVASLANASRSAGAGGAAAGAAGAASVGLASDEADDDADSVASVASAAAGAAGGGAAHARDAGVKPSAVVRDCRDAIRSAVRGGIDWTADANRHVLFHLVLAVPFTVADVRTVGPGGTKTRPIGPDTALGNATHAFPLAHQLGRLLDHVITTNGQRRKAADTWVWWSFETLMRLASRRACAMGVPFAGRPCDCVAAAAGAAGGAAGAASAAPGAAGASAPGASAAEDALLDSGDDASDLDTQSESE